MSLRTSLPVLFTFTFVLAACLSSPPPSPPPANTPPSIVIGEDGPPLPTGDTALWIGWLTGPDSPNPRVAQWSESFTIFDMVYSTLYRLQPDGSYIPDLAVSFEPSADQKTWTLKIRSGVTFHDGQPLTARDVAFSLNLYGLFSEVIALDDLTVEIHLHDPIPNMIGHVIHYYILPQHKWARYENAPETYDNLEMIGSGPFQMSTYAQETFVHLKAVENHYLFNPHIEDVIYLVYPDEIALVDGLRAGDIQLIFNLPYIELESLRNEPNIEVVTGLPMYPNFEEIIFNQIAPENCPKPLEGSVPFEGGICSGHPALRDRNVRLALAYATNKAKLIDEVLLGQGDPGVSIIPTGLESFYDPDLKDYGYDPGRANQILDQAGYLDTDGDGVREMPTSANGQPGRPLIFRFNYLGPSVFYTRLAEHMRLMWEDIGIALDIEEMDLETITYACCPAFDYDIIVWAWGVDPEPGFIFNVMDTALIPSGYNETGFSNPEYDILNAVQHTEIDPAKRREYVWQMQQIIHDEVAQIVLFYAQSVGAYRSDQFTGWITDAPHLALEDFSSMIQVRPVK